jgi:hypothetical protein
LVPTRLLRRKRVERDAFLHRLLSWDLDRAILAHGEINESGAKVAIERAWRFAGTAVKRVNIADSAGRRTDASGRARQ